ncbi:MAG TPA: O-antigen ligase family protein [bacterium]|nr:O-antigen ligase family protein [bacterium]
MNRFKDHFVRFCFSIFLVLPPFLLGGVYSHTGTNLLIISILSAVSLCFFSYLLIYGKPLLISSIFFPLAATLLYAVFQLVPLPLTILELISPRAHFFHLLEGSGARPLTMSIPDTLYSVMRISVLILFSIIAARTVYLGKRKWKQTLIDTIIFISTVVIFISAALRIVDAQTWLYGALRHPGFLLDPILINPNHAAAFFGISAILSLTSIYSHDFSRKKIFYGSLFFIHSIAVVSTLSRGGILAFAASLIFFLLMKRTGSDEEKGNAKLYLAVSSLLLALFVVFQTGYVLLEKEFDFEREGYFSKIEEMETVRDYMGDFYLTGSGLGSFSKVYPYYQNDPERRFAELENEPVQFLLENGIFFGIFIFAMLLWIIAKGRKDIKRNSGFMSVFVFVLLHNTIDFNLHNFSTLFPVIAVAVLTVEPLELSGKKRIPAIILCIAASLFLLLMTLSESGRKAAGYGENFSYDELVYSYPADYSVPMNKAIEKLNATQKEETGIAGKYATFAMLKAPRYYFTHYLAGNYLLRLGSIDPALQFYRKSIELSGSKYPLIIRKIYNDLKSAGKNEEITRIISVSEGNTSELERFLFEISRTDSSSLKFIHSNEELFFLSAIRGYLDRKEFDSAETLIAKIESSKKDLPDESRGRLLIYKGLIFENRKDYRQAFEHYSEGAALTGGFFDHLQAAYCSLHLDKEAIDKAEKGMKSPLLKSSKNIVHYYKWLSKREFLDNNYADGFKYLEKAVDISKNSNWRLELANTYSRRGMHYAALKGLVLIKKERPDFSRELIDKRIEEEKKKLSDKEQKNFNELMLK